jgi:hypothetical protein
MPPAPRWSTATTPLTSTRATQSSAPASPRTFATPSQRVRDTLEAAGQEADHPREAIDLVCVADPDCWRRHSSIEYSDVPFSRTRGHGLYELLGVHVDMPAAHPVAILITELWGKLAKRDTTLHLSQMHFAGREPLETAGAGLHRPLAPLISTVH